MKTHNFEIAYVKGFSSEESVLRQAAKGLIDGVFFLRRACDSSIRVRIDGETKKKAARVLDKMGLSISDAVRCVLAYHLLVAIEKTLHDQGLHIS